MSLDELRRQIDEIDGQLVRLLQQRADTARRIGQAKSASASAVYDPAREAQLLERIARMGAEPLPTDSLKAIYRQVISGCRALQALSVSYLGPQYTNTYLAALKQFGPTADLQPTRTVAEVFRATERERTKLGIVPIENSLQGVVGETYDCLVETSLKVCSEAYLPVHHALLANCEMRDIQTVYSHPQVLAQSREWLREHLPGVEQIAASSSASAAQKVAREPHGAAIAPAIAAEPSGLSVLAEDIEDRPDNRTRFFVLAAGDAAPTGKDKTSIVFSVPHRAGSLHDALAPLHNHGINMSLIQSRPARARLWEYVFFVDVEGHATDEQVMIALDELSAQSPHVRIIGSYPAAE